jgi:hypothetical protein
MLEIFNIVPVNMIKLASSSIHHIFFYLSDLDGEKSEILILMQNLFDLVFFYTIHTVEKNIMQK